MKRRVFLAGAAALAAAVSWRFVRARDADAVTAVIYKRLGYLPLDPLGVRQFARDFVGRHLVSGNKLRAVAALGPVFRHLSLSEDIPLLEHVGFAEDRIATTYLLSTDFFSGSQDGARPVRYQGYYDAMRGCANPFRRTVPAADNTTA